MANPDSPKLHFINGTEYDNLTRELALEILEGLVTKHIIATKLVAINRGGARPAQIISDFVGLRFLSVDGKSYLGVEERGKITELQGLPKGSIKEDDVVVLVDEICDQGVTLEHYKKAIETLADGCKVITAVVFARSSSKHLVDHVAKIVDEWIVFPNEFRETVKNLYRWWSVDPEYKKLIMNGFIKTAQIPPEMVERIFAEVSAEAVNTTQDAAAEGIK